MRLVQAVIALIVSALFLGVLAGVAAANVPGVAINAPLPPAPNVATAGSDAMIKAVLTHLDTGLQTGAPMAAGEMARQAPMATKAAKPTIKRKVGTGELSDKSGNIPRATYTATPFVSVKPSLKARSKASPATKYMAVKASVKPTMKPTTKYLAAKATAKPTKTATKYLAVKASVKPTKKPATKYLAAKAKARPTMKPTTKYLAVKATAKPTKKPGMKYMLALPSGVKTPAESYGIYGLGGNVPSPPKAAATVKPVPSGSPTPVPGFYTPRYPGEAGAGKNVTVPQPSPTPRPATGGVAASSVSIPYTGVTGRGTIGQCSCVALASDNRYAGRGPGLVGTTIVNPPSSAPGPNAVPRAFVIVRRR